MSCSHLLIVAHPDDETIFFGGLVMTLNKKSWRVIVVTDGNADGQGELRKQQFFTACEKLGAQDFEMWDFPDRFEQRLDQARLSERLQKENAKLVFTHGPLGEYGHPHHQDVSWAVHRSFRTKAPVWSPAYNSFGSKALRLTKKVYEQKASILSKTYLSETIRFARQLPVQPTECFHQLSFDEVDHLYQYFTGQLAEIDPAKLKTYRWFLPYLEEQKKASQVRPF